MPLLPRVIPSPACSPTWAVWEQPSACLISLVCLLVPLVYVLGLFLWYRNRSRRKARQKAAGEAASVEEDYVLLTHEDAEEEEEEGEWEHGEEEGDGKGKGQQGGLCKLSWGVTWTRELVGTCHILYHALMMLAQRRGDGWGMNLVLRGCVVLSWSLGLVLEERLFRDTTIRRLPLVVVGWYVVACGAGLVHALLLYNHTQHTFDTHSVEVWESVLVCVLGVGLAVGSWGQRVQVQFMHHFSPELNTGLWSNVMFSWVGPMVKAAQGGHKIHPQHDVPPVIDTDTARHASEALKQILERHPQSPLWTNLVRLVWGGWVEQQVWRLLSSASVFIAPLALRQLVQQVHAYSRDGGGAVPVGMSVNVCLMLVGGVVNAIGDTRTWQLGRRIGGYARAALASLIMQKALRLDVLSEGLVVEGESKEGVGAGELTNLLAVDAQAVLDYLVFGHMIIGGAEVLILTVVLLYNFLGLAALGGLCVIVVTAPLNSALHKAMKRRQATLMKRKDERMRVLGEALYGIRVIKLFAWEDHFDKAISAVRELELACLGSFLLLLSITTVILRGSPTIVALLTFVVHTQVLHRPLDAAAGFASLALFNLLRFPLMALPEALTHLFQAHVALARIQRFLQRPEVPGRRCVGVSKDSPLDPQYAAVIEHASFAYTQPAPLPIPTHPHTLTAPLLATPAQDGVVVVPVLRDISVCIPRGALTLVLGATGGGKTSLLTALMGEIHTTQGGVRVASGQRVGYVAQKAWIMNHTLRENIVFGHPWDGGRYERVIKACALESDLAMMAGGDLTEIGEKGVNLSGGQQQRVNLARALYSGADLLLLDDVLSAVDAPVGEHLFHHAIRDFAQHTTRVLVSHQVSLCLPHAQHVIVLNQGTVVYSGPPSGLGPDHLPFLPAPAPLAPSGPSESSQHSDLIDSPSDEEEEGSQAGEGEGETESSTDNSTRHTGTHDNGDWDEQGGPTHYEPPSSPRPSLPSTRRRDRAQRARGRLIEDEGKETHDLPPSSNKARPWSVYVAYFSACGPATLPLCLALSAAFMVCNVLQSLSLGRWVKAMETRQDHPTAHTDAQVSLWLWRFVGMCVGALLALALRAGAVEGASLRASRGLHAKLLHAVLHAPTSFFDATPMGRLFNRFSHDLQTIDKEVMQHVVRFLDMVLQLVGVTAITCIALPLMTIPMVGVLVVSLYVSLSYLHASRQLKAMEAQDRSPLFAHFAETVTGLVTLRAYGVEDRFLQRLWADVDQSNRSHYHLWMANYWMSTRLRLLGAVVSGLTALTVVLQANSVDDTAAGLALTYALPFSQAVVFTIRTHAEVAMAMNAVERVVAYMSIPQEAPPIVPQHRPPPGWPSRGEVLMQDLVVRYRPHLPAVLQGVSCLVKGGSKVAIVGRTGSGKSTLLSTLFRLVEPESGVLRIDGVDVRAMGLKDLRTHMGVIPQDPVLFKGSIRSNLDTLGHYSDADMWDALRRVHLHEGSVSSLDQDVGEGGGNLSVGERQLLCFARALLKKTKIVVMDEATANVDPGTDAHIQHTIRSSDMAHCTLLCIAHRLHTVMYYDHVLVLEGGRVVEQGSPASLLKDPKARLRGMAERTGDLQGLLSVALQAEGERGRAKGGE